MKKTLVFVAAFALVLVAGAAVAFMATPGDDVASEEIEAPTASSDEEKDEPPAAEEPKEEESYEEDPPKEEHEEDPPKEETGPEEPAAEEAKEDPDTEPPHLEILHPEDGQHFDEKKIAFEGKTEPGARVFAGKYEADVDEEGNWRIVLILTNDGGNLAKFVATDAAGNESTAQVQAYYDAPVKNEPKDEGKDHEFTAYQKFGSCGEEPPYDIWQGTGEPGTKIWIGSEFGSNTTTIGEKGKWDLKVKFKEAPCNDTFNVVLETDAGHRKVYEFTRICDEGGHEEGGHDK